MNKGYYYKLGSKILNYKLGNKVIGFMLGLSLCVPALASAQMPENEPEDTIVENGLIYDVYADSVVVVGMSRNARTTVSDVVIPETIDGREVVSVGEKAFSNDTRLQSVIFPYTLRSIASQAFEGCSSLMALSLPDRIEQVGDSAFMGCSELKELFLPESLTRVSTAAFADCRGLMSIELPGVTDISDEAFSSCTSLNTVYAGSSLQNVGDRAFSGCEALTEWYAGEDAVDPPVFSATAFEGVPDRSVELHAPHTLADYAQRQIWESLPDLYPVFMSEVLFDDVTLFNDLADDMYDDNVPVEYYSINGLRMTSDNMRPGVYIIRRGNHVTKSVKH